MKTHVLAFIIFVVLFCSDSQAQKSVTGTLTASNGKTFTLSCEPCEQLPSATDTCNVSKDISGTKNPFGITIQSGWLGVADAFFVSNKENILVFKIIRETSNIVINGKKQEHFVKGKKMKIVWN